MQAAPDDPGARLAFYRALAGSELYLLLTCEVDGHRIDPEVFDISGDSFVLAFDREDRLAGFAATAADPVPYAALSGRRIVALLAGQGLGLGFNLDVAPSAILIPPAAVAWLAESLAGAPVEITVKPEKFCAPKGLPEIVLAEIDTRLAAAEGLAQSAILVGATYEDGRAGHLLAIVGARPGARAALTQAVAEGLALSGLDSATLDLAFFAADDPAVARMAACGLRFDLPQPGVRHRPARPAPGHDPDRPPILR